MNLRLLAGRLREAWVEYPAARRAIKAVPAGRPIFLTGAHRSGTTWLASMLACSGIWYVHEPFAPYKGRWPSSFSYRPMAERDDSVDELFTEVLNGGFRSALGLANADHPLMPLRIVPPSFDRLLVKDPLACLLTGYLTKRFDLRSLVLFRHPAGFASSVCRLGWPRGAFLRQFLDDRTLMEDHLEPYRALLERHAGEDSLASAAVLHGAINRVLWHWVELGIAQPLVFEHLCDQPIARLEALFGALDLPYNEQVRDAHMAACLGDEKASAEYLPHEIHRNSMAMSRSWVAQVDDAGLRTVREIWDAFQVPLYQSDQDWHRG
ncbi:sulfotransferase [Arenimonas sp.]|uniref:sulfotransferase n=1 Tax=Arenimonas sp. TaxID=1872635 RepID=UPI0039E48E20